MRRRILVFVGAAAVLLTVGLVLIRYVGDPARETPSLPPRDLGAPPRGDLRASDGPAAAPPRVRLEGITGSVEVRLGAEEWHAVRSGSVLDRQGSLRTGPKGGAVLRVGEKGRLVIGPSSELSVQELSEVLHHFTLDRGHLKVDYAKEGWRVLRVESGKRKVVAQSREARFSVLVTDETVAVATETGVVDLKSAGRSVRVPAGQQSVVQGEQAPSEPLPIPKEVLLKVAGASGVPLPMKQLSATVRGHAAPGSRVEVGGQWTTVRPDGSFEQRVALRPGVNRVQVVTEDPSGRRRTEEVAYYVARRSAAAPQGKVGYERVSLGDGITRIVYSDGSASYEFRGGGVRGKTVYLGVFPTLEEARAARARFLKESAGP
ncbi:MAG: FecR domain-containing protein [Deltaproteobacteria bacterium]|nr:FecR domain-containing protein [Deltaproteobacteria bacterium]